MFKYKTNKISGITLIALVITIIVLLILAGISISMLAENNGILTRVGEAKEETIVGQEKESVELAYITAAMKKLGDNVTREELQHELDLSVGVDKTQVEGQTILDVLFTDTNHSYTVDKGKVSKYSAFKETIASVESSEDAEIRIKLSITGSRVTNPPIPSGFRHTVGNISDGYVITDETNEFVWVPVDKNQKIKLEVTANENIGSIKLYHPDGTATSYTATGTSYENDSIYPTTNGIYIATAYTEEKKVTAVKILQVYSLYENNISEIGEIINGRSRVQ